MHRSIYNPNTTQTRRTIMGFTTILENENGEVAIEIYTGNPPDNYEIEIFPSMDALVDRFDRDRFKAEQLLTNTKSSVILSNPFLSTIMMNLNLEWKLSMIMAGVTQRDMYINPINFVKLSPKERVFLICHEVMHIALATSSNMYDCMKAGIVKTKDDLELYNIASDYVINKMLYEGGVGDLIKGSCLDDAICVAGGNTQTGVYKYLKEKQEQQQGQQGQQQGMGGGDSKGDGQGSAFDPDNQGTRSDKGGFDAVMPHVDDAQHKEQQMWEKQVVKQAAQTAKMFGIKNCGAGVGDLIRKVLANLESKVDWVNELRDFVVRSKDDSRSYARMNRRFLSQKMFVPSPSGESIGPLLYCNDMSGSITQKESNQAVSELVKIKNDFNPERLDVIYFDTKVSGHDSFGREDELVLNPVGGGGTRFAAIFEWLEQNPLEDLQCIIVLTDMQCSDYGNEPDVPVLWISTQSRFKHPPFGSVVVMSMDD